MESAIERAFAAHLERTSDHAAALRRQATRELVRATQGARAMGWSQRRIAKALGRSQPEISRLLKLDPEPAIDVVYGNPPALLDVVLSERRDEIVTAAARRGARNVRLFGSVAVGADTPDSDIDLLVDLDPGVGLFALGALEAELQEILGREVDVVVAQAVREPVAETLEAIPL